MAAQITIGDLGGGNTAAPSVTGGTIDATPIQAVLPEATNRSGDRLWMDFSDGHHLDGAWVYDDVARGEHGLRVLDLAFSEAAAQQATAARVVRVQLATQNIEPAIGSGTLDTSTKVYCPACTILHDEGF